MRIILAAAAAMLFAAPAPGGQVLFVDADAPGGNGSSWPTAMTDLRQALLFAANPANGVSEVWVAGALYRPDGGTGIRSFSFPLVPGVAVYGGFAGDESSLDERDPRANLTVLSGDIGTIDDASDNSYHVVSANAAGPGAVLDGFTIVDGTADGGAVFGQGGGIFLTNASPTVVNCQLSGHQGKTGAALFMSGSSPTFTTCTFSDNQATEEDGGAVYILDGSPVFQACTFQGNFAPERGGAIFNQSGAPLFTDCLVQGNAAPGLGPVTGQGGGLYSGPGSLPELVECTFESNTSEAGGALYHDGIQAVLEGCHFTANLVTDRGGAIHNEGSGIMLLECHFSENCAVAGGGALANTGGGDASVEGCTFNANETNQCGGGVFNDEAATVTLSLCDFTANCANGQGTCRSGGAAFSGQGTGIVARSCTFTTNLADEEGGAVLTNAQSSVFDACTFSGNFCFDQEGGAIRINGPGSIVDCHFEANIGQRGGAVFLENSADVTIRDSLFLANGSDATGGALGTSGASFTIVGCDFIGNVAGGAGGAMQHQAGSDGIVHNCRFIDNLALAGGAVMNQLISDLTFANCLMSGNVSDFGSGGAVLESDSNGRYINCTIAGNHAVNAGGGFHVQTESQPIIGNCIVWGNTAGADEGEAAQVHVEFASVSIDSSCVEGWSGALGGTGNIGGNPLFKDDGFRLGPGSPCVDSGDNGAVPADAGDIDVDGNLVEPLPFDLEGRARFIDDPDAPDAGVGTPPIVDMGALERPGPCPADVNGDGTINVQDLVAVVLAWGSTDRAADVVPDGIVNVADLVQVILEWGPC